MVYYTERGDDMMKERTIIQLDPETKEQLRHLAYQEQRSIADLVREAVENLLSERRMIDETLSL